MAAKTTTAPTVISRGPAAALFSRAKLRYWASVYVRPPIVYNRPPTGAVVTSTALVVPVTTVGATGAGAGWGGKGGGTAGCWAGSGSGRSSLLFKLFSSSDDARMRRQA